MTRFFCVVALAVALLVGTSGPSHADIIFYSANLSGPAESPPNASPGVGFAFLTLDDSVHTLRVQVTFSGLLGTTTAAHIHTPTAVAGVGTAGVATTTPTFAGFPLGVTSGTYDNTLNLLNATSYNPAFVTLNGGTIAGAEAALLSGLAAGKAYLNIHSSVFGGGEIRGFLAPAAVPEPASLLAWGISAFGLIFVGRRQARISALR